MIYYRGNKLRAPTLRLSGEYQVFVGSWGFLFGII